MFVPREVFEPRQGSRVGPSVIFTQGETGVVTVTTGTPCVSDLEEEGVGVGHHGVLVDPGTTRQTFDVHLLKMSG